MLKLILVLLALLITSPSFAQPDRSTPAPRPRIQLPDPLNLRGGGGGPISQALNRDNDGDNDLLGALEDKLLPDLKFALNIARANNNELTGDCWAAWIAMIEARQKANVDEQGTPLTMPEPALITKFQKLVDIRNALQPTSPFMRSCSPVITMVKSDVRKFIGAILTGGFGLAAMGIGL